MGTHTMTSRLHTSIGSDKLGGHLSTTGVNEVSSFRARVRTGLFPHGNRPRI